MNWMITSREPRSATARAIIEVVRSERGASAFARCFAESPQKIIATKNHGAAAWAFVSTFGGGLVSGDSYELAVDVGAHATLFIGNQSATKVFCGTSSMTLSARVGDGALLVSWPHPVACFAGANYVQNTLIEVAEGASVLLFDAWTSGRPAHEPPFSFDSITTRTRVTCSETPLFAEGLRIAKDSLPVTANMHAFATVLACGPRVKNFFDAIAPTSSDEFVSSVHVLSRDRLVIRAAAHRTDALGRAFSPLMRRLADALGDDPFRNFAET